MKLRWLSLALVALTLHITSVAENRNAYPLPEERGTAGILASLERLPVYARVLYTTAHPDDEGSGTLTWLSRKAHARTALFALTRGEGGQNILGSEKYEALGLVRTGELLEACRMYGVELYFSTAFDFGFSKSADETLAKWGHETTLEEMVRFIRTWRPAVIISRFQGSAADGHGHHQAAGIITREAFRAAGDPGRFPDQLKHGLRPWQAAKLYVGAGRGEANPTGGGSAAETATRAGLVRAPIGDFDPVLGRSYREIGSEGYSKHRTQGNGAAFSLPGRAYDSYRLVDSTVGGKPAEDGFFGSIDNSLPAIADLAGTEKAAVPFLREDLDQAQKRALEALQLFKPGHPAESAAPAAKGAAILAEALRKVRASSLSDITKGIVADALEEKLRDFSEAVNATLGIYLVCRSEDTTGIPGQKEALTAYFFNRGTEDVQLKLVRLISPEEWFPSTEESTLTRVAAGNSTSLKFAADIWQTAQPTEPFFYRAGKEDARYKTRPTRDVFATFGRPEISARAIYQFNGTDISIEATARGQAGDALRGADFVAFQIVPALSVSLSPDFGIAPLAAKPLARQFQVAVLNNDKAGTRGTVRLIVPAGWKVDPAEISIAMQKKGETSSARFTVDIPQNTKAGTYPIEAVVSAGGKEFRRGYEVISYPENWTRNLYSPSLSDLEIFDVRTAPNLTVGYIMGSGDDLPAALEQLGVKVQLLSGSDLAFGDLSRFSAIVTGIRAYNVNEDLRANNQRLLQYVSQGGTLIVQYNRLFGRGAEAPFPYGPYPMSNSDADRITMEESPVRILDPQNPVFNTPNKIGEADFQGWVQERGAYFMRSWDSHYTALLSGNDTGEKPLNGGMLMTKYGKGYYIFTAYSWFRQLPAGVPGAFRIFANMLSLGRQ